MQSEIMIDERYPMSSSALDHDRLKEKKMKVQENKANQMEARTRARKGYTYVLINCSAVMTKTFTCQATAQHFTKLEIVNILFDKR